MKQKWMDWLERITSSRKYVETMCVRDPPEQVLRRLWKKRTKIVVLMLVILLLSVVLCATQEPEPSPLVGGRFLQRAEEEETIPIKVQGQQGEELWEKDLNVSLVPREFTEKEKKTLDEKTESYLRKKLPGKNSSLDQVTEPLVFPRTLPETDMEITWTVDDTYLGETGGIQYEKIPSGGVDTDVVAEVVWKNWKKTYHFSVHIVSKEFTLEEQWKRQIQKAVEKSVKDQADKARVELPEKIGDTRMVYSTEEKGKSYILVYLVLGAIFLLPVIWREQQKKEQKERDEQLLLDHPGVVNKFMLLLGAGLTVRKVVERLAREYEKERQDGGKKRYVYEELCVLLQEMKDGVSETKAIERFGKRCRLLPYLRFSSVITQNMKKGAEGLLAILETEALESLEQRKERALQLGEKAGTKLLFPMILMLGIVMGIIMVPAFMTM